MIGMRVVLLLVLAGLSMFLAAVEASYHLLKRRRIAQLLRQDGDDRREALVEPYLEDPRRLLMPVHLGTYAAHVGMTVIITSLYFEVLTHWAMLAAFATMMAYLLLFRVSLPYLLVSQDPERSFLRLVPAFNVWARALRPVVARLRRRGAAAEEDEEEAPPSAHPELPPPRAARPGNSVVPAAPGCSRSYRTPRAGSTHARPSRSRPQRAGCPP